MVDLSSQQLRNRRVGPDQLSLGDLKLGLVFGALVVFFVLACCHNQMQIMAIQYEIEGLANENSLLKENYSALQAEYESARNPEKILSQAYQMGMISASRPEVTIIEAEPVQRVDHNLLAKAEASLLIPE